MKKNERERIAGFIETGLTLGVREGMRGTAFRNPEGDLEGSAMFLALAGALGDAGEANLVVWLNPDPIGAMAQTLGVAVADAMAIETLHRSGCRAGAIAERLRNGTILGGGDGAEAR